MITVRKSNDRGHAEHGWLKGFHTFSFADYQDPAHLKFRTLRVINEDWISPARGFGMHPHRNMEILTYVISGAIEHKDSLGSGEILRPGEIQRMTAGKGILHSEMNPSETEEVHLLQIWITPEKAGLPPSYEQKKVPAGVNGALTLIGSRDARDGSVKIHQDVEVYAGKLKAGSKTVYPLKVERFGWIQVVTGVVKVNGVKLETGDGASAADEKSLEIAVEKDAELLLFDLS